MNRRSVPDIETFRKTVQKYRGHKSNIAAAFGVERHTLKKWLKELPEYADIVEDARGRMFDDTIENAWLFANGIKDIQNGKFVGWLERPDGNTLRYLLGTLGREEGFGEHIEVKHTSDIYEKEEAEMDLKEMERRFYGRELTEEEEHTMFLEVILGRDKKDK